MSQISIADIISAQWLVPGVHNKFDSSNAIQTPREMPRSVCVLGQINNPLFNPAGFYKRDEVTVEAEAIGLWGEGSMLHQMWVGAKKNAGKGLRIFGMALPDDETAIAAQYTLTITASTGHMSGELPIYIAGDRVSVGVPEGSTSAQIAQSLYNKLLKRDDLSLTAISVVGSVVTLKSKIKGAMGNQVDLRTKYYASDIEIQGVSVAIARSVSGAVNPDLSEAIVNARNYRDTEWVIPYIDGATMAMIEEEALRRWSHEVQTDFQFIWMMRGTEGEHTTALASRNNPLGHSLHVQSDPENPWVGAAMAGAAIESMAMLNPCTPHTGVVLKGYRASPRHEAFDEDQINSIMLEGGSGLVVQEDGTATLMRMVTNYTKHNTGALDTSMRELTWIKNLSWFRWFRNVEFAIKTQGFLLGEYAEPMPGQKIMTDEVAKDFALAIYDKAIGIARMQNRDYYEKSMLVQLDGPRGLVKIQDEPIVMNSLYQNAITSMWSAGHVQ